MMETVKKILVWTLVAFVIYAVFRYPSLAADAVSNVWSFFVNLFDSLIRFFNAILTGG